MPTIKLAAVILSALLCVSGCSSTSDATTDFTEIWANYQVMGDEVEPGVTLPELAKNADEVIAGKIVKLNPSRKLGEESQGNAFLLSFQVLNQNDGQEYTVEILLGSATSAEQAERAREEAQPLVGSEVLVLARHKGGEREVGLYRPINSNALWAKSDQGFLPPLAEDSKHIAELPENKKLVTNANNVADVVVALSKS